MKGARGRLKTKLDGKQNKYILQWWSSHYYYDTERLVPSNHRYFKKLDIVFIMSLGKIENIQIHNLILSKLLKQ